MKKVVLYIVLFLAGSNLLSAQDLLSLIGEEEPEKEFVKNAFKSTRVISSHSLELVGPGVLDLRILHRFGRVNGGAYEAFGLDMARIRIGLDYGISKRLMVGIGRSSYKKEADAFVKYRLLWQASGKHASPVSVLLVSGITNNLLKYENPEIKNYYTSRLAYYHQLIVGRKFSDAFSFQLMPVMVHNNLVQRTGDSHDIYAVGAGTRLKLTKRLALTADYYYQLPDQLPDNIQQPLSIGLDIETGGHVFQLHFTNALGMNERVFLTETDGMWSKGDIYFGFNISRVFTLDRKKPEIKE